MNEVSIMWQFTGGLAALFGSVVLYMMGGRPEWDKLWRRMGSAIIMASAVNILSAVRGIWDPWMLAVFPLLWAGLSMGYGADSRGKKILRRTLFALGVTSSGWLLAHLLGAWWVLPFHVGVGAFSVYLGVKNPVQAVVEEGAIATVLFLGLLLYPFI